MSRTVLHVIQQLTGGGAARVMLAFIRNSTATGEYRHTIASLRPPDPKILPALEKIGARLLPTSDWNQIRAEIAFSDLTILQWWNSPEMDSFLTSDVLPPARLIGWHHIAGHRAPHVVSENLVKFLDVAVGGSQYTAECPSFEQMRRSGKHHRVDMAIGLTDFSRVAEFKRKPHEDFVVGYIGTVHPIKIHPQFVELCAAVKSPDCRFVIAGSEDGRWVSEKARALGIERRIDYRGYSEAVQDLLQEFDVFGYPLCENTYAASELVLQEAMYCGIPPVVFPYGGIKRLVQDRQTGLVVSSIAEYGNAIDFLRNNPDERARLGANAARFARDVFNPRATLNTMHGIFERLLAAPKRVRAWGHDSDDINKDGVVIEGLAYDPTRQDLGSDRLVESFDGQLSMFPVSKSTTDGDQALAADEAVGASDDVVIFSGLRSYRQFYDKDPWLAYWNGLTLLKSTEELELARALHEFVQSLNLGFPDFRASYFAALTALKLRQYGTARELAKHAENIAGSPGCFQGLFHQIDAAEGGLTPP